MSVNTGVSFIRHANISVYCTSATLLRFYECYALNSVRVKINTDIKMDIRNKTSSY